MRPASSFLHDLLVSEIACGAVFIRPDVNPAAALRNDPLLCFIRPYAPFALPAKLPFQGRKVARNYRDLLTGVSISDLLSALPAVTLSA